VRSQTTCAEPNPEDFDCQLANLAMESRRVLLKNSLTSKFASQYDSERQDMEATMRSLSDEDEALRWKVMDLEELVLKSDKVPTAGLKLSY
jgi:ABC-type phosphate transport system auxiliary subunit